MSCLFLSACDKEEKIDPSFPIEYEAIINDSNYELSRVFFYAHTYFPEENETFIHSYGKNRSLDYDDEYYLEIIDTLVSSPSLKGYIGCQTYLEVRIYYKEELSKEEEVFILQDTINNNDGYIKFEWPQDTVLF